MIADADTGYGNELNVTRTVREYAQRGVAGLHIEDQTFPKKCGQLDDKEVIPHAEFIAKVKAAVAARPDPDFVIIARTDARAVLGLDAAVERMNAALEAGADMAFLEAPQTLQEVAAVPKLVRGPCLLNLSIGGRTPLRDLDEAERAGYRVVIVPGLLLQEAMTAFAATLMRIEDATPASRPRPSMCASACAAWAPPNGTRCATGSKVEVRSILKRHCEEPEGRQIQKPHVQPWIASLRSQ